MFLSVTPLAIPFCELSVHMFGPFFFWVVCLFPHTHYFVRAVVRFKFFYKPVVNI